MASRKAQQEQLRRSLDRIADLEEHVDRLIKATLREEKRVDEALMEHAKALDRIEESIARVESRSAKVEPGAGAVKEWLPVLARMQEVTLAAMGHADMAQQFGLTDRQREQAQDATPDSWIDTVLPKPEEDAGMIYDG